MGINPTPLPQLGWASLVTDLPSRSPSLDVISFSPYPSRNFFHNSYHHRHLCWFLSPPTNALVVSPKLRSPSSNVVLVFISSTLELYMILRTSLKHQSVMFWF
ncbi:unnamed protein product [Lactuca virosa]|uniref:Uncharacterized protein n=1 Tax=Lactuca virosa TaxID=75947 RepID=A0AAU9N2Y9_9ASTR|nr:unnamed protein product [Lactuca virosa]